MNPIIENAIKYILMNRNQKKKKTIQSDEDRNQKLAKAESKRQRKAEKKMGVKQ